MEKNSETKKEKYSKGELIVWNNGLTEDQMPENMYSKERNSKVGILGNQNGFRKGEKRNSEFNKRRNDGVKRAYSERKEEIVNKILNTSGRKRFIYSNNNIMIKMRSNWEVLYAKYLDTLGYNWKYEEKGFRLSNGKLFYPDFYLNDLNEWHEVKGYLSNIAREKIELFKQNFAEEPFVLLDKNKLTELGVL